MRTTRSIALPALLLCAGLLAVGTSHAAPAVGRAATPKTGAAPWPAPPDPLRRARLAGLTPERHEFVFYHVHAVLLVYVNGKQIPVPAGIGINIHDPAVKHGKIADGTMAYGGIDPPCKDPCISPLHTHDDTGLLHTESKKNQPNRLGQFFTEWGVALSKNCVGGYCKPKAPISIFLGNNLYTGDPRAIQLKDKTQIAIVIGTFPKS